jgi:sugar phosphate isomerase/epimerase
MIPAISQVCSLSSPFEKDIEAYAAARCPAVELWLTKWEDYLQRASPADFLRLLDEHQVRAPVASVQGGLLVTQGAARKEAWDLLERRLALCRELRVGTLVVAADIMGPVTGPDVDRAQRSLEQLAGQAERHQVRAALEFQARAALGNNLQTAAALIENVGSAWLGICLDAFHFCVGPSKLEDLVLLTPANLFHVQVCDLAGVTRELARDADRILPGDGDLPLQVIVDRLRNIGYSGCVALELMNPQIWPVPALQLGEIGMTALRKLLGLASMD